MKIGLITGERHRQFASIEYGPYPTPELDNEEVEELSWGIKENGLEG